MAAPAPGAVISPAGAPAIAGALPRPANLSGKLGGRTTYHDYGDVDVAWHTIGLASTATVAGVKPPLNVMLDYVARLVRDISAPGLPTDHANTKAARRRRMGKVLMAAHTILQFRFERFDLNGQIDLRYDDRALGHAPWNIVPGPVPHATLVQSLNNHRANLNNRKLAYDRDAPPLYPSPQQLGENRELNMIQFKPISGRLTRSVCYTINPLLHVLMRNSTYSRKASKHIANT